MLKFRTSFQRYTQLFQQNKPFRLFEKKPGRQTKDFKLEIQRKILMCLVGRETWLGCI